MKIDTPKERKNCLQGINPKNAKEYHSLLLEIFRLEMEYRADEGALDDDGEDFYENVYWCGLLLFCIADLNDIGIMWKAKHLNMDMGCGFDIQFLLGSGLDKTVDYLNASNEEDKILEYIEKCHQCGDFDYLDEWKESKIAYFYG
jgi:hypothetical protein